MIGRLLCWLGYHRWLRTTDESPAAAALVCQRCSAKSDLWPHSQTEGEATTETDDPPPPPPKA